MKYGLFTCPYQRLSLERAFSDASILGYDYIELWGGRPHAYAPDLLAGDLEAVLRLIDRFEMPVEMSASGKMRWTICRLRCAAARPSERNTP